MDFALQQLIIMIGLIILTYFSKKEFDRQTEEQLRKWSEPHDE